jgi:hypothetical protein
MTFLVPVVRLIIKWHIGFKNYHKWYQYISNKYKLLVFYIGYILDKQKHFM